MNAKHRRELRTGVLQALAWLALGGLILLFCNLASAATPADRTSMLFPYYEADAVLNSVVDHHHLKKNAVLLASIQELDAATVQYCKGGMDVNALKAQYAGVYLNWLELSAVVMGPMLTGNLVRQIDFRPVRVGLLERAVQKQPQGAQAMALIGSPAKGFPAYEYLLGQPGFKAETPMCFYAQEVVQDIARTLRGLNWQRVEPESANMSLYFNQLVGAMHNLAWESMEKPLLKRQDKVAGSKQEDTSPDAGKASAAQWHSISGLLLVNGDVVPQATVQVVPLEAYLRGLGKIDLADRLVIRCAALALAMQDLRMDDTASTTRAVSAAKALKGFLETEVASGLKVSIQFSSSDGD